MKLCFILVCAVSLYTEAKVKHTDLYMTLCSDTDTEKEVMYGLDGEEMLHGDFIQQKEVYTLPDFADPYRYGEGNYEEGVANLEICKYNLALIIKANNYPAVPKIAPQTSVYSKHRVQVGSKNTLTCYITGFYPSHINISWTRNNVKVTDGVSLSRYYPTSDGSFNLISTLSFTPDEGDIYTCTVEHTALERPLTKTWDVQVALSSVGPAVFCGVGLAAGLLGVTVGTFFLVKGNNCN